MDQKDAARPGGRKTAGLCGRKTPAPDGRKTAGQRWNREISAERRDMKGTNCEECAYFEYDEEAEEYSCSAFFDEDDIARAYEMGEQFVCPYFQSSDEYRIVRKQM